jgi:hypothetical protein
VKVAYIHRTESCEENERFTACPEPLILEPTKYSLHRDKLLVKMLICVCKPSSRVLFLHHTEPIHKLRVPEINQFFTYKNDSKPVILKLISRSIKRLGLQGTI